MVLKSILPAAAAIAACLAVAPATAKPINYICKLKEDGRTGWIPDVVGVNFDTETGKVIVSDPIILHFTGQPVEGRISVDNARRITFNWESKGLEDRARNQLPSMSYRLSVQKSGLRATIFALPGPYDNRFTGRGKCQIAEPRG